MERGITNGARGKPAGKRLTMKGAGCIGKMELEVSKLEARGFKLEQSSGGGGGEMKREADGCRRTPHSVDRRLLLAPRREFD